MSNLDILETSKVTLRDRPLRDGPPSLPPLFDLAEVAKLVDAHVSGACGLAHVGSTPTFGIIFTSLIGELLSLPFSGTKI